MSNMFNFKFCILTLSLVLLSGCDLFTDYGPSYFKIRVDSFSAPDSVHVQDTLVIKFWAHVGDNACQHFWDFETLRNNNQLDLTLWGFEENTYRNNNCLSKTVTIDGVEYRVTDLNPGTFKIIVHQKSGGTLEKTVQINPN